jgi:hypothetical protein
METTTTLDQVDSIENDPPPTMVAELPHTIIPPVKRKRVRKAPQVILTNDPNVQVEVRSRKTGPKAPRKIIVYREDIEPEKIQIIEKSSKPRKTVIEMIPEPAKTLMPPPRRQPTLRDLKKQELDLRFQELQHAVGRPLRQTCRGKVDQRCISDRTEAQIASVSALVARNKHKAEEKRMSANKASVKEVISELSSRVAKPVELIVERAPSPAKRPPTLSDLFG